MPGGVGGVAPRAVPLSRSWGLSGHPSASCRKRANPGSRQVDQFYEPWNIVAFRLMENSFDAAHIAFVHRKTFGNTEQLRTDGHRDIKRTAYGFEALNESRVKVHGDVAHRASTRTAKIPCGASTIPGTCRSRAGSPSITRTG